MDLTGVSGLFGLEYTRWSGMRCRSRCRDDYRCRISCRISYRICIDPLFVSPTRFLPSFCLLLCYTLFFLFVLL